MNALETILDKIESYPDKYIPVSSFCEMVGIKRPTITRQITHGEIAARFDGYKHHLLKSIAKDIVIKHKAAIFGWVRQKEILDEFSIKSQVIFHICKSRGLVKELDYLGNVRLPPETVSALREILPQYLAKEIMQHEGRTYYSVTKLSYDMAKKVEKGSCQTDSFKCEKERIYKCLYNWCQRKLIPHMFVDGPTRLYVPDFVYDNLTGMVRVIDSAKLSGLSRETIYNWIDKGILPTSKSPSGSRLINLKDLDDALVLKMQLELMREYAADPLKVNQISEFNSPFWNKMISSLRTLGGDLNQTEHLNGSEKDQRIEKMDGWSRMKMRAVRSVAKKRTNLSELSLNKTYGNEHEGESKTLVDFIEDKSTISPDTSAEIDDMLSLVKTLPKDDYELICRLFGMENHEVVSMSQLAEEKGIPLSDLQSKIDGILSELKESLV